MEKLILFAFAAAGLSWILVKSKLFKPLREWLTLSYQKQIDVVSKGGILGIKGIKLYVLYFFNGIFNCEGCMGFWSACMSYLLIYKELDLIIFAFGFAGSIISLLIIALFNYFSKK